MCIMSYKVRGIKQQFTDGGHREGAACRVHLSCNFNHTMVVVSENVQGLSVASAG